MSFEEKRRRLVAMLRDMGYIRSESVYRAMLEVPRELFVPEEYMDLAYEDRPLPIGHGQTISAPSIVAHMTELLSLEEGHRVLEVGTGSGYQAAVMAAIVSPPGGRLGGHVWSVERIGRLAEFAKRNLAKAGYAGKVTVIVGDGSLGYPPEAPYDRIMVTAAAPEIPAPLIEQLKPGGKMVIPVGRLPLQSLIIVEKDSKGDVRTRRDIDVVFVPLLGQLGWKDDYTTFSPIS